MTSPSRRALQLRLRPLLLHAATRELVIRGAPWTTVEPPPRRMHQLRRAPCHAAARDGCVHQPALSCRHLVGIVWGSPCWKRRLLHRETRGPCRAGAAMQATSLFPAADYYRWQSCGFRFWTSDALFEGPWDIALRVSARQRYGASSRAQLPCVRPIPAVLPFGGYGTGRPPGR